MHNVIGIIVGSDIKEPMIIGGFRRYQHTFFQHT